MLPPEHQVGTGEALVRGAEQQDRELVTRREYELQVGDHLVGPPGIRGSPGICGSPRGGRARLGQACAGQQLRQGQAAEVLWQAEVHGRGLVQLGDRRGQVLARADLEEAGQSLRGGIGGVPLGQVLEVAASLRVGACRYERSGQGHYRVPVGPRPAGRLLQRSEQAIAGNWSGHGDLLPGAVEPQPVCLMGDEQWPDRAPVPTQARIALGQDVSGRLAATGRAGGAAGPDMLGP